MNNKVIAVKNPDSQRVSIINFIDGTSGMVREDSKLQVIRLFDEHYLEVKDKQMYDKAVKFLKSKQFDNNTQDEVLYKTKIELGSHYFI